MDVKKEAKREENAAKPTQTTVMLRLVAGGYLVYLTFGLLQEYLKPAGGGKMVQLDYGALSGVTSVFLTGWSFKRLMKGEYIKYGEIPGNKKDDQTEDT